MAETAQQTWDDADKRLGSAIRERRHERGLTLVQVATDAGLSHPFLSQLERGLTRPSMRSLFLIAEALGTTQQALLAAAGADGEVDVDMDFGGGARLLGPAPTGVAVTEFVCPPGTFGPFFRHDHAELLYVVAGTIEVEHQDGGGTTLTTLRPRGTIGYPGGVEHRFRQVGPAHAVVLAIHGGIDE